MLMPKVIEKEDPKPINPLLAKVADYVTIKRNIDDMSKQQNRIKSELSELVDTDGEPDEKGHLIYELPEKVFGVTALKRQRRVSQSLNESIAEDILKKKDIYNRCYKMVPVLDESEVMACLYDGLLTEEEIDEMFPKTVSYAFYIVEE
jgi:hypothetical protein